MSDAPRSSEYLARPYLAEKSPLSSLQDFIGFTPFPLLLTVGVASGAYWLVRDDLKMLAALMLVMVGLIGAVFLDKINKLRPVLLVGLGFFLIINPRKHFGEDVISSAILPALSSGIRYNFVSVLDLILALMVLLILVGRFPAPWIKIRNLLPGVTRTAMYGFLIIMLASVSYAPDRGLAWAQVGMDLKCLAIMIIAANLLATGRDIVSNLGLILLGLSLGWVVEGFIVLLEYLRMITEETFFLGVTVGSYPEVMLGGERIFRSGGTYRHPNILGGPAGVTALLLWQVLTAYRSYLRLPRRSLYWAGLAGAVGGSILAFSRGPWLFTLVGFAIYVSLTFWLYGRKWLKALSWGYLTPVLAAAFLALALFSGQIYNKVFRSSPMNMDQRTELNAVTIDVIEKQPLLGGGIGNHTVLTKEYAIHKMWLKWLKTVPAVHNIYLLVVSEVGLLGALLYFLMPFSLLFYVLRDILARPGSPLVNLGVAFISSLSIFLLIDLFTSILRMPQVAYLFWFVIGGLAGVHHALNQKTPEAVKATAGTAHGSFYG